jgi:translation initiation factor 4G
MYKDLLELRENAWTPRRKEEKAKTLEEIRKDVEREEQIQAQQSVQMNQSGGYRGAGGATGGGRGGGGGGYDRSNRGSTYGGGSTNTRPRQPTKPVVDDDGFTTIGGTVGKSRAGGSSLAQAASAGKQPQRILQNNSKRPFGVLADDSSSSKPRPEPLDKDQFDRRCKTILSEFIQDPTNQKELLLSVDELTGTDDYGVKFVSSNADRIIDCKDNERKAISSMLGVLVEKKKLSLSDVQDGLMDLIEFIDSYVYDAPLAFEYLGHMLATMIRAGALNVTWVGEQAEKTKVSDPGNPEKIIRALIKSIESDAGPEAVKAAFGPHQKAMESLLGADKWTSIKKEVA